MQSIWLAAHVYCIMIKAYRQFSFSLGQGWGGWEITATAKNPTKQIWHVSVPIICVNGEHYYIKDQQDHEHFEWVDSSKRGLMCLFSLMSLLKKIIVFVLTYCRWDRVLINYSIRQRKLQRWKAEEERGKTKYTIKSTMTEHVAMGFDLILFTRENLWLMGSKWSSHYSFME